VVTQVYTRTHAHLPSYTFRITIVKREFVTDRQPEPVTSWQHLSQLLCLAL